MQLPNMASASWKSYFVDGGSSCANNSIRFVLIHASMLAKIEILPRWTSAFIRIILRSTARWSKPDGNLPSRKTIFSFAPPMSSNLLVREKVTCGLLRDRANCHYCSLCHNLDHFSHDVLYGEYVQRPILWPSHLTITLQELYRLPISSSKTV